jgi:hypothetical protein
MPRDSSLQSVWLRIARLILPTPAAARVKPGKDLSTARAISLRSTACFA